MRARRRWLGGRKSGAPTGSISGAAQTRCSLATITNVGAPRGGQLGGTRTRDSALLVTVATSIERRAIHCTTSPRPVPDALPANQTPLAVAPTTQRHYRCFMGRRGQRNAPGASRTSRPEFSSDTMPAVIGP